MAQLGGSANAKTGALDDKVQDIVKGLEFSSQQSPEIIPYLCNNFVLDYCPYFADFDSLPKSLSLLIN